MPFQKDDKVRYDYDNSVGVITGQVHGNRWQVRFNAGQSPFIPEENLELIKETQNMFDYLQEGKFQGIKDFRRTIYRYRLTGELTNIFYSMNNSSTKFMAHQFIPVIKFLESYTNRLLIADEVGLGKTIESMYIWEELKTRSNAKRLLIVVPSVLSFKWQSDLKKFFNIDAQIVSAQNQNKGDTLLQHIEYALSNPIKESFSLIISLEGLRISSKVKDLLEDNIDNNKIFDLVIIDEAHNMRNSGTKSFKTGALLRDTSNNLLLLSATPIQTGSDNLFNLLNLLSPEDFYNKIPFDMQLKENIPLVQLTNAIDSNSDKKIISKKLEETLSEDIFSADEDLISIKQNFENILQSVSKRVETVQKLKEKYFYNNFVTRTRKRDVMEDKTERKAMTIDFRLSDTEKEFYARVTAFLKSKKNDNDTLSIFRLIARQRQMASCMPAALKSWRETSKEKGYELTDEESSIFSDIWGDNEDEIKAFSMPTFDDINLEKLEKDDSKFNEFLKYVKEITEKNPEEKIVVFSFFRNTVSYLFEKLNAEGISSVFIMGGMTGAEKDTQIKDFRDKNIKVLVSSEVGSEGIDLQFAKYEVNYDLPWNPMRLEQRIGRIDRIGQKSPQIYILNAFCSDTIEDKILKRLYERIELFKNTLGDVEEILGKEIQDLEIDVFNSDYQTQEEIDNRTAQVEKAILNKQRINKSLEMEAGNLSAYQNFILKNIKSSYDNFRRVTPEELIFTVKDFLNENFPGSSAENSKYRDCAKIVLSQEARDSLSLFMRRNSIFSMTRLTSERSGTLCSFNAKIANELGKIYKESVDINHPLIKWILSILREESLYTSGCSAISIEQKKLSQLENIETGVYPYYIQQWQASGVKNTNELHFFLIKAGENIPVDNVMAERILTNALLYGNTYDTNNIFQEDFEKSIESLNSLIDYAWKEFSDFESSQKISNRSLFEEQKKYIQKTSEAKIQKRQGILENMRFEGQSERILKMQIGLIDSMKQDAEDRIRRLSEKMNCQINPSEIATGLLYITEK